MKKKLGIPLAASGQQPQALPQQLKKPALRPEPKATLPPSPAVATASEGAAPTPAAAPASVPAALSAKSTQGMSHEAGKPEAAASTQHAVAAPSPAAPTNPTFSASHQTSHVKMETASRSASPAQGHDSRKVPAASGAAPACAPQGPTRQGLDSAPKPSDAGPSAHSQEPQVKNSRTCSS